MGARTYTEVSMDRMLFRLPDAATTLSLSETKLRDLISRGEVLAVEVDGVMRVAVDDLVGYKERLRATARAGQQRVATAAPRPEQEAPLGTPAISAASVPRAEPP